MIDDTQNGRKPDLADQLKEAVRKRQQAQELIPPAGIRRGERWEPLDDAAVDEFLHLASEKRKSSQAEQGPPDKSRESLLKDWMQSSRNLMLVALGLGGIALILIVTLALLVYWQNYRINRLSGQVALVSEQLAKVKVADTAAVQSEMAQLHARLDELAALINQNPGSAVGTGGGQEAAQLRELNTQLEARIEALENSFSSSKVPPHLTSKPREDAGAKAEAEEIQPDSESQGPWYVNLASLTSKEAAEALLREFQAKGVNARMNEVAVKDKRWYRLWIGPFKNQKDAAMNAARMKELLNVREVWVTR